MKTTLSLLIVLVVVIGGYFYFNRKNVDQPQTPTPKASEVTTSQVTAYVSENISTLSPEKEQVGGTFFVTRIEALNGKGVVEYEDGHNAYTADFTYTGTETGEVHITSFKIREG